MLSSSLFHSFVNNMVEPLRFGQTILGHKETTTAAQMFMGPLLEDIARIVEHSDPAETVQKSAVFRNSSHFKGQQ